MKILVPALAPRATSNPCTDRSEHVHHPDPTLAASIHSDEHLDDLVRGAIVPFRQELRRHDPQGRWSLWMIRYARCGAHLKVRLHGPEEERTFVQCLLAEAVERHFATLGPLDGYATRRVSRPKHPPIDEEDDRSEDYPDRTLIWTRYRRSGVSLGPCKLLVEDDRYVSLFTASLARGGDLVLDALRPGLSETARLRVLLNALTVGLTGLDFSPRERAVYLTYHCDWLLRFLLPDAEREREMLVRFDDRVEEMHPLVEEVRRDLRAEGSSPADVGPRAGLRSAVSELVAYLVRFRGDPAYIADPFSEDPVFPPVFKVFHSLANQLGVDMLNEALVHHVLLHAVSDEPVAVAVAHAGA